MGRREEEDRHDAEAFNDNQLTPGRSASVVHVVQRRYSPRQACLQTVVVLSSDED
jgi:hypothetical protein